jgi:HAD superfamily hydrolase (TIGR01509 family)
MEPGSAVPTGAPGPGRRGRAAALLVDFNGTLSQDEDVLFDVYAEIGEEHGATLARTIYFGQLVGRSDEEILRRILGPQIPVEELTAERIRRYRERIADGTTILPAARAAVAYAAGRVPVAVVTSAWRAEVVPALRGAGLTGLVAECVCADDVARDKPDPEGYLLACSRLGIDPRAAVAVEDTDVGIAAAVAAGVRCAAVTTTMPAGRLRQADELIEALSVDEVAVLLGSTSERTRADSRANESSTDAPDATRPSALGTSTAS